MTARSARLSAHEQGEGDRGHMSRGRGDRGHISEISAVIVTSEQKLTAGMQAMLSPSYLIPLFTQTFTILILCLTSERIDLEELLKDQLSKCKLN